MKFDPYKVLGLKPDATDEEVRTAYRKKAFDHHPDRNPGDGVAARKFRRVQKAYDTLTGKSGPEKPQVDATTVQAIGDTFQEVVLECVTNGWKIEDRDVPQMMREKIIRETGTLNGMIHDMEKVERMMTRAVGRMTDKEDLLYQVANAKLGRMRHQIRSSRSAKKKLEEVVEILKGCTYDRERGFSYLPGFGGRTGVNEKRVQFVWNPNGG